MKITDILGLACMSNYGRKGFFAGSVRITSVFVFLLSLNFLGWVIGKGFPKLVRK